MSELAVKRIYDQLFSLESKVRKQDVYPIHKRLVFDEEGINDIYGWLAMKLDFEEGDKVLDAGCGVGFGSCLLAKMHDIEIMGISLSDKEVKKANSFAKGSGLSKRVTFRKQSFDTLEKRIYNKIIAVESIKHSLDLSNTLQVFVDALVPGGTLYIVEDFYDEDELTSDAKSYMKDWNLIDAFRLKDYFATVEEGKSNYYDLTKNMPTKSRFLINLKLAFNNIMSKIQLSKDKNINEIFRGGFYLDRLYSDGLMKYGLLEYSKK